MDEAVARQLVERHLEAGAAVERVSRRGDDLVVVARGLGWALREVPRHELLLPPGLIIVEARPDLFGVPVRRQAFVWLESGGPVALHEEAGFAAFLGVAADQLDPLTLALIAVAYRVPFVLDDWPVTLVTGADDLHEALAGHGLPIDLAARAGGVDFTTELRAPIETGELEVGLDRWALRTRPDPGLASTAGVRHTVAGVR